MEKDANTYKVVTRWEKDVNTLSFQDNLQVEDREVNHHGNAVKVDSQNIDIWW